MRLKYILLFLIMNGLISCSPSAEHTKEHSAKLEFDSLSASKYGADEYGMKKYVMAFLKRGPNRDFDNAKKIEHQKQHLENIGRLAHKGKLIVAGPFLNTGEIRGIYIFNVESISEAEQLTNSDPAIEAGSLVMELKEWCGSAGLMAVNSIHKTLAKNNISSQE